MDVVNNGISCIFYKSEQIHYSFDGNKCFFKLSDVANILQIKDYDEIKNSLDNLDRYSKNSCYLTESGLYTLIFLSKYENKQTFKKCVIDEIERIKSEQNIRYSLRLKIKEIESKKRDKEDIVYISSSKQYSNQHQFKIGGVGDKELLTKRLSNYDSRSAPGDEWGFCDWTKVFHFPHFETRFWHILSEFRSKPKSKKEFITMYYEDLVEVFMLIANNYNKEIDFINNNIQRYLENLKCKPKADVKLIRFDTPKAITKYRPSEEELKKEIEKYMNDKRRSSFGPIYRQDVIEHCFGKFENISKKIIWVMMKQIQKDNFGFNIKYYAEKK